MSDPATFGLTHDLGAPIRHVIAFSAMLREQGGCSEDPESLELLEHVQQAAILAQDMLQGLNRIAALSIKPSASVHVDIGSVIERLTTSSNQKVDVSGAITLRTNPNLIEGLFVELLENARKHADTKRVWIDLQPTANGARIRVGDDGIGIDPNRWPELCWPFRRGAGRAEIGALGLGLAIVERITVLHQGSLELCQGSDTTPWHLRLELNAFA